jgi:hypothetical protein
MSADALLLHELLKRIEVLERGVSELRGRSLAWVSAARQRQAHRVRAVIKAAVTSMKANPPRTERYRFGEPVVSRSVPAAARLQAVAVRADGAAAHVHRLALLDWRPWPVGHTPAHSRAGSSLELTAAAG